MNTHFLPTRNLGILRALLAVTALVYALTYATPGHAEAVILEPPGTDTDDIEIVAGEDKTIFEYRSNGILMIIKVVPKEGKPYYMVPADGSAHYKSLDHSKKLYPQWVILEW